MRHSSPTLHFAFCAIAAALDPPTGIFSDATACKKTKACDSLASARGIMITEDGRASVLGAAPDGTVWTAHGAYGGPDDELAVDFFGVDGTGMRAATWDGEVLTWENGAVWRRRHTGFAAQRVEGDQPFDGVYASEAWAGGVAGLRLVSRRMGRVKGISVTVLGTDDGRNFFEFVGAFRGWPKSSESFFMDFRPVGGVDRWDGIHTFDGSGSLIWPDGARWYKLGKAAEGEL